MTTQQIFEAAMSLPDESKATLAERLVAHLASQVEPEVERAHLDAATRRRDEILSGEVEGLDGEAVMARARKIVGAAQMPDNLASVCRQGRSPERL